MSVKTKVFIVEDDPIILAGYKAMLKNCDYEVIGEAYDGETAITKVIEQKPDLVIMDINLPVMDGLTSIEKILQEYFVPCVVITGYNQRELLTRANKIGVFGYLQKPIDENNIRCTLSIAMNRYNEFMKVKQEATNIKEALDARKIVERAKGILMDKFGFKEGQAMQYIQKKSRDKNKKLVEIAREIIKADKMIDL